MERLLRDPSGVISVDGLVQYARDGCREVYGAECCLFVRSEDNGALAPLGDALQGSDAEAAASIASRVMSGGAAGEERLPSGRTLVAVAGVAGGATQLVLLVNREAAFDEGVRAALQSFASLLAAFLRQSRRFGMLQQVAQSLLGEMDLTTVLRKALRAGGQPIESDRCALFLHDEKHGDLVARVFDEKPHESENAERYTGEVRFPATQGIAGHVCTTRTPLVVADAYASPLFNQDVDRQTGFRTRSVLAVPVIMGERVVGVMQLINKRSGDGTFTADDLSLAQIFASYCAIAITNAELYTGVRQAERRLQVAMDVLQYHTIPSAAEIAALVKATPLPRASWPAAFDSFSFDPLDVPLEQTAALVVTMFHELGFVAHYGLDPSALCGLVLAAQRGYRDVPYHCWRHAFWVTHHMFVSLRTAPIATRYLDMDTAFALLLAAVCHDIDHRGTNNAFVSKTGDTLSQLYDSAILEQHHLSVTISLLAHPSCALLAPIDPQQCRVIQSHLRDIILATDLASYFKRKDQFRALAANAAAYDRSNDEHRRLLADLLMTGADLSMATKPFEVSARMSAILYEEFFEQGDAEKALGSAPIPMMDREACNIPQQQVGFMDHIAKDAYGFLVAIVPELHELAATVAANRDRWSKEIVAAEASMLYLPRI